MKLKIIQATAKDKSSGKILVRVSYPILESIIFFGSIKKVCKSYVLHTRDGGANWFFQDSGEYADSYWLSHNQQALNQKKLEQQREENLNFKVTRINYRR